MAIRSISSIEDLQLLLFSDSLGKQPTRRKRAPQPMEVIDAQPAQQALCKVRTEVAEVTRDMVNRSNAHFMLWPPCVEVMKIQYVNQKPTYTKVVVSVVDHVECRCQSVPRLPPPRKKSSRRGPLPGKDQHYRNQTIDQQQGQAKTHSKEVLHRQDELKKNQRVQPGQLWNQHWSPRGDTFTSPEEEDEGHRYSPAGTGAGAGVSRSGETILHTPHWVHNASRLLETRDGPPSPLDVPGAGAVEGGVVEVVAESVSSSSSSSSLHGTGEQARVDWGQQKSVDGHQETRRGGAPTAKTEDRRVRSKISVLSTSRKFGSAPPTRLAEGRRRGNETPEEERRSQQLEEERMELLLLHKRLDQEKELIRLQQLKQEEEQHHLHHKQHHHLQTTTQNIVTTTPVTTRTPVTKARPRVPARPNQRRRRLKNNRKKISKAAMRAMLM
ncbi:hypothetical protein CRUP_006914 [Coryphaenoides rupestris]|nr:hypothetical protein CRUP_006914 [Coryphaenoides rupestris]